MIHSKVLSAALGLAVVLGLTAGADAKGVKGAGKHAKHSGVRGKITAISGNNQFTLSSGGRKNGKTVTVTVGNSTTFMIEGKSGKFEDLKAGDRVTVEPDASNPSKVTDRGQGHHKGKKAAK